MAVEATPHRHGERLAKEGALEAHVSVLGVALQGKREQDLQPVMVSSLVAVDAPVAFIGVARHAGVEDHLTVAASGDGWDEVDGQHAAALSYELRCVIAYMELHT